MQNKGAIKLFAIALALVSVYQLSFTFFANYQRKKADGYANEKLDQIKKTASANAKGDAQKEITFLDSMLRARKNFYLDSMAGETAYNFFFLRKYTLRECMERELNLGLDLKGGMNVLLEVSVVDLIRNMANNNPDSTFQRALRLAQENEKKSSADFVTLFGEAFKKIDPNAKLSAIFGTLQLKDKIGFKTSNDEVLNIIRKEANDAIDNSFNILRSRIDKFGVVQPNIQKLENTGRILVELPGINDPARVRKLLEGTANLEFWETYENKEVFKFIELANNKIKDILNAKVAVETAKTEVDTAKVAEKTDNKETTKAKKGKNKDVAKVDSAKIKAKKDTAKDSDALDLVQKLKKDSTKQDTSKQAKTFAEFSKNNPLYAVLSPNVDQKGGFLEGAIVGYSHVKDTAKVNAYLRLKQVRDLFPRELRLLWEVKAFDKEGSRFRLFAIKDSKADGKPALSGDVVTEARAEFGQSKAVAEVDMVMNGEGANLWAKITKENIGRQVAIVLDNNVYSCPTVQSEIKGGRSQISGNFTITEAKDLANILKSGKMPAPARIIQEEVVGPSLGEESIKASMMSFIIAFILVLAFMIFYYSGSGIVANLAMMLNLFFIFGILASMGAVLTLPGIAGIVLTMAMAVDANVLIYERVLEEVRQGKSLKQSIGDGFRHALSAIIDSHVTAFITGVILYKFGTGPIQGFATTTIIGILTSLFTSILVSRIIIEWYLGKSKELTFTNKLTVNWLTHTKVDFIGVRKYFYVISSIFIISGIVSIISLGFDLGIDFKGGRTYIVRFDQNVNTVAIQDALKKEFDGHAPEVKTFGSSNQVKIATKFMIDDTRKSVDSIITTRLYSGVKGFYKEQLDYKKFTAADKKHGILNSQKVGPTIADDLIWASVYAVIIALAGIFIYILARFRNWKFSLGAVASLAHDVLFVLGAYSLLYKFMPFSLEIDQAFIAAILTIIGYSIMDTVVVFDRIREYINMGKTWSRKDTYNMAMNSTLRRTLNTSATTLLTIIAIFVFGGDVIRGFMFALLIGIGTGTYSSIFIATSIVYDSEERLAKIKETNPKKA